MAPTDEKFDLPLFQDRLWDELEQLHAELTASPPNRSRRRYLLTVAGLSAAACLAIGAIVVTQGNSDDPDAGTSGSPTTTEAELGPGDDVIVVIESPVDTRWEDTATGAYRLQLETSEQDYEEAVAFRDGPDGTHPLTQTYVDHANRTYWVYPEVSEADGIDIYGPREAVPLADGILSQFTSDGTEVIDGRELQRLIAPAQDTTLCGIPGDPQGFSPDQCVLLGVTEQTYEAATRTIWIDPATGHTVREVDKVTDLDMDGVTDVMTYTYLPRTPENLALLGLAVPEGYIQAKPDFSSYADMAAQGMTFTDGDGLTSILDAREDAHG